MHKRYPTDAARGTVAAIVGLHPIYTVRSINDEPEGTIICLEEIDNAHLIPAHGPNEPGFIASAFRPIVENKKPVSFTMGADPDSESWDNRKHAKEKV